MISVLRRLAVSVIAFAVVACSPSTPSGTVNRFFHLVEAEKYNAAFALFTSQSRAAFPAEKAKEILAEQSRKMKAGGGLKSVVLSNETITGETATVTAVTTMGNGKTSSENYNLAREHGKWLIAIQK